jgi:hypothetical protein
MKEKFLNIVIKTYIAKDKQRINGPHKSPNQQKKNNLSYYQTL